MLNQPKFYWGTTRKAIVAFGNMFNNISIMREDAKGNEKTVKVPVGYGPKDKFLARIQEQPDLSAKTVAIVVPRMAFEMGGIQYDSSRKMNSNNRTSASVNGTVIRKFSPVPYNLSVNLYIYTKSQDEGLQIIEQILPTFRPSYALSMNAIPEFGLEEDLHIILDSVSMEDNYEGDLMEKRSVIWTLSFTMQLNFHPRADDSQRGLIKRTEVGIFADRLMHEKIEEIATEVTPFDSDPTDKYEIVTTFEGLD